MERIHVSVRARPLTAEEAKNTPWRISTNSISIPNQPTKFEFDQIFGDDCKTVQVYEARTKDIVAAAVRGFNGTVFAYGQTNSGKTYTMRGSPIEPGVIRLAMQDLFDVIQQEIDREFLLRMSYMEIYNEEINDLLAPEHRKLQIHESVERGIFVAGLREEIVASPEQVLKFMEFGESHRHIGETNMNVYSSRSHTIFRMIIESRDKTEGADLESSCDAVRVSVLNLVDLAGSERAAKTGAEGVRLKEGSHINKSLMALGTVIKKLSEGVESNGGHVPYRDSKLTRILQPALGGNANTAIICNITLAQIHADETKSSLQFASRALRVTNCVHVNEILTDAALLKRQKKEIQELRAKLQGSHSEHLGDEILNLRNTLLKSELERERIALELEEEKKAQAEKEKRLLEQAKKIENLSTMVLFSNRDEKHGDVSKKEKRRDTWCPGKVSREVLTELCKVEEEGSSEKPVRTKREVGPMLSFNELVNEEDKDCTKVESESEECNLPDPCSLLNVTSRRKAPVRKRSLLMDNMGLLETQAAYKELLVKFENHRSTSEIQIEYLKRRLAEADCSKPDNNINTISEESEAILVIKQLQEKITMLEMEKSSSQQKMDSLVELATEQTISANKKYQELYEELLNSQEEVKIAREQYNTAISNAKNSDFEIKLFAQVEELLSEVENTRNLMDSLPPIECFSEISNLFVDLKEDSVHMKSMVNKNEELYSCLKTKIYELKNEKVLLYNESMDLRNEIEKLNLEIQNCKNELNEVIEEFEAEKSELISELRNCDKEILKLSSSSLAKEKESLRKDLEKTKMKLKEIESKLRNVIQEKTKLEGEKARTERDMKKLHQQKAPIFAAEQAMQDEYRRLETLLCKMETHIASLEEELTVAHKEKDEANSKIESLTFEIETLTLELNESHNEVNSLEEEISVLKLSLEEAKTQNQEMESSVKMLEEEKEDLALQLTDVLLGLEEEKAIWSAKEKASLEAINVKSNSYKAELANLSLQISEMKNQLEICSKECKVLKENEKLEKKYSKEMSLEIDRLRHDLEIAQDDNNKSQQAYENLSIEHQNTREIVEKLKQEKIMYGKEITKHRLRLGNIQIKLDTFRLKYKESLDELDFMNSKYEAASKKLKDKLATYGIEILNLKKELLLLKGS